MAFVIGIMIKIAIIILKRLIKAGIVNVKMEKEQYKRAVEDPSFMNMRTEHAMKHVSKKVYETCLFHNDD